MLSIIKIGGNVIDDKKSLENFLNHIADIKYPKILIHGGGKIATQIGDKIGIKSKYHEGRRITDKETLEIVTMVYGGLINKNIVSTLQKSNCNAIGLTGADMNLIPSIKRNSKLIDYGFVGDIITEEINIEFLKLLINNNITPVIAPLGNSKEHGILNINADTIASNIAIALSKYYSIRLIYCFEKKGILENINDENSVINKIDTQYYKKLLLQNKLFDGILPKLENAFEAINKGVKEVVIGHADNINYNIKGNNTIGTLIFK